MGVTGDFAQLKKIAEGMGALANKTNMKGLARALGAEALAMLKHGFADGRDPYGNKWAPTHVVEAKGFSMRSIGSKASMHKPLIDTGRLRNSFSARPAGDGFEIGTNVMYAEFHQYGTDGRKKALSRRFLQNARGRFISAAKAAKAKKVVKFGTVTFKAGTGKIPARMFLPVADRGLGTWGEFLEKAAVRYFRSLSFIMRNIRAAQRSRGA